VAVCFLAFSLHVQTIVANSVGMGMYSGWRITDFQGKQCSGNHYGERRKKEQS
jgi:hypothetical protein